MQHSTTPSLAMYPQDPAFVPVPSSCTPDEKPKKVPRPPNAFMLFRSWLIRHGMLPPEVKRCQQNISKIAGKAWNMLDESSKDEWRKEAFQRLQDHERHYPDRKFDLLPNNCRTGPKGVGRVVKNAKEDTARRLKPLSDVHARGHRAAGTKGPRRERALPYKFPVAECTPHGPTRGYQTPQSTSNVQSGSSSMSPMTSSNPPSSYSTQAFSLSPLDAQPNTLTHGIPQQPLPYAFFSLGLPNHFEQAYEQEDGVCAFASFHSTCRGLNGSLQTVVFSDNYAPINPFSPPPGYYTGMFPMANPSQMVIGPSTDTPATILSPNEQSPPHAYLNLNTSGGRTRSPIHRPPAVFSSMSFDLAFQLESHNESYRFYVNPIQAMKDEWRSVASVAQIYLVPPNAGVPWGPLSAVSLTAREQEVFSATLGYI